MILLMCVWDLQFADESHHRDVNHTFAELQDCDPSPFVAQHRSNAMRAWELERAGETAWPAATVAVVEGTTENENDGRTSSCIA